MTRTCIAFRPTVFKTAQCDDLIQPPRTYQYKSGCAAIKVIEVMAGSFHQRAILAPTFGRVHNWVTCVFFQLSLQEGFSEQRYVGADGLAT